MRLYHLTAVPPGGTTLTAYGSFSAPRQQEVVLASGSSLELYRLKDHLLQPVARVDAFATIRALDSFRLPGTRRDYIVLTSDAGAISILQPDPATATFRRVHCEVFGKSGCRRIVPGQFLACDPKGRACMVAAVEKQKFAYVLNRDSAENLTISSPLEAHKSHVATHGLVALDVGFENPMFAALERSYEAKSVKSLVYYELDLGLNHVVRKLASPVHTSSFIMLPVPGDADGPGGVLVCSEGCVTYRSLLDEDEDGLLISLKQEAESRGELATERNHSARIEARLPYREGSDLDSPMVVCGTVYRDKKGAAFFFLLCTEHGDFIKAELSWTPEIGAKQLRLAYFDTLPGPALDMRILRSGFLMAAIQGGDALFLKFEAIAVPDDDPAGGLSSSGSKAMQNGRSQTGTGTTPGSAMEVDTGNVANTGLGANSIKSKVRSRVGFVPREKLANLSVSAVFDSCAPALSLCSGDFGNEGSSQLVCATGSVSGGGVRVLRRGLGVLEMSTPHVLPARLVTVFAFREKADDEFHRFIVVGFVDRTKVLRVGEARVEEVYETGFELSTATLVAAQIATDSFVQVHATGVRYIPGGRAADATEWRPPVATRIVAAASNQAQVAVALSSGTVVYFEVDEDSGALLEIEKLTDVLVPSGGDDSTDRGAGDEECKPSLALPDVPAGRKRASFLAVGDGASNKVRLYRLGGDSSLQSVGLQIAPAPVESLALVDFGHIDAAVTAAASIGGSKKKIASNAVVHDPLLTLVIGTKQGALVRTLVDPVTGAMSGKRSMFLGPHPVRVQSARMAGVPTCLMMGTRPWIMHPQGGRIATSPLCTEAIEDAAAFSSKQCADGFVSIAGSKLRLLSLSIDALYALSASAALPPRLPPCSVPSMTSLSSSFYLSRTRTAGTPRRVIHLESGNAHSRQRVAGKRPRAEENGTQKQPQATELGNGMFVVVETDHRAQLVQRQSLHNSAEAEESTDPERTSLSPAPAGSWASRVRLVQVTSQDELQDDAEGDSGAVPDSADALLNLSPRAFTTLDVVPFTNPEESVLCATSSACLGPTSQPGHHSYVIVSVAHNLVVSATSPNAAAERAVMDKEGREPSGSLHVYRVDAKVRKLELLHTTRVTEPVYALVPFRDMVLVGVGRALRLYDLGKKQLLRKAEYRIAVQNRVSALAVAGGDRVFVGDIQESVCLFKYIAPDASGVGGMDGPITSQGRDGGRFMPMASDSLPRWVVALLTVDYNTVCGCDKFGNLFVLRLPSEVSGAAEEYAATGGTGRDVLGPGSRCAAHKLSVEACVHVGSTIMSLTSGTLCGGTGAIASGRVDEPADDAIIYSTMNGAIGALSPIPAKSDADFIRALEAQVRKQYTSVCGRDHISYRSSFYPVKNVVDGDLCEMFVGLTHSTQRSIANILERPVTEILRKLEDFRGAIL